MLRDCLTPFYKENAHDKDEEDMFVSQFNRFLDVVIVGFGLYFLTHFAIFTIVPIIAIGIAIMVFIYLVYNRSQRYCHCEYHKKKHYNQFLLNKYNKISIEDKYWQSQQQEGETLIETKQRILLNRKKREEVRIKRYLKEKKE